eukprot:SM000156S02145  [mRNA]  locus=s156:161560:164201:- [translate_table: standard]
MTPHVDVKGSQQSKLASEVRASSTPQNAPLALSDAQSLGHPPQCSSTLASGVCPATDFYEWNALFFPYCDVASFSEDVDQPVFENVRHFLPGPACSFARSDIADSMSIPTQLHVTSHELKVSHPAVWDASQSPSDAWKVNAHCLESYILGFHVRWLHVQCTFAATLIPLVKAPLFVTNALYNIWQNNNVIVVCILHFALLNSSHECTYTTLLVPSFVDDGLPQLHREPTSDTGSIATSLQIDNILAPPAADPFYQILPLTCRMNLANCTSQQLALLQDLHDHILEATS